MHSYIHSVWFTIAFSAVLQRIVLFHALWWSGGRKPVWCSSALCWNSLCILCFSDTWSRMRTKSQSTRLLSRRKPLIQSLMRYVSNYCFCFCFFLFIYIILAICPGLFAYFTYFHLLPLSCIRLSTPGLCLIKACRTLVRILDHHPMLNSSTLNPSSLRCSGLQSVYHVVINPVPGDLPRWRL